MWAPQLGRDPGLVVYLYWCLCVSISPVVLVGVSFNVSDNWLDVMYNSAKLNASTRNGIGIDVVTTENRVSMYCPTSPQKNAGNLQARIQKGFYKVMHTGYGYNGDFLKVFRSVPGDVKEWMGMFGGSRRARDHDDRFPKNPRARAASLGERELARELDEDDLECDRFSFDSSYVGGAEPSFSVIFGAAAMQTDNVW